jgi:hypothetical protein
LFVCFVCLLCFSCLVIFCICLFCLLGLQGRGSVQSSVQSDLSSVCKGASQNIGSLKHRQSAKQMSQQLGSCLAWQRLRQACWMLWKKLAVLFCNVWLFLNDDCMFAVLS